MTEFALTAKQHEAMALLRGPATHVCLEGGSRSGKTFLLLRAIAIRALKASGSRHAVFRFRFNHAKTSLVHDTWPKMMSLCFPGIQAPINKTDWFAEFPNGSQVWFGGLDDKERVEKVLGQEHSTIFLNECSQIGFDARNTALTRLAQKVEQDVAGTNGYLPLRMYYDLNPPKKRHWVYQLFHRKMRPGTLQHVADPNNFVYLRLNPADNAENLPPEYLQELDDLPERLKRRFKEGLYSDDNDNALWNEDMFQKWRFESREVPRMSRIVVAVDPSGAGDDDNESNDDIGVTVCGLGVDGNGYLLEDLTIKAGPATWGKVAVSAYHRHMADRIVGEDNFGGAMVEHVIKSVDPDASYKNVKASRNKVQRAEPVASLYEQGRIRHVGRFDLLESELMDFTKTGYVGTSSPNRGDAVIWGFTELFPGLTRGEVGKKADIKFASWGG